MDEIDSIFREALKAALSRFRSQRELAGAAGITPPYLNDLLHGRRAGADGTKRKIAERLGYPGRRYEDFLDIGRERLNIPMQADSEGNEGVASLMSQVFVDFSDSLELDASDGIPVTEYNGSSSVAVRLASLVSITRFLGPQHIRAFLVEDTAMEPAIFNGSIIITYDTAHLRGEVLGRGKNIYLIAVPGESRRAVVRYVSRDRDNYIIKAENSRILDFTRPIEDVIVFGKVILIHNILGLGGLGSIRAKTVKDGLAKTEKGSLKLEGFDENFSVEVKRLANGLVVA
jgi:transcriptional regulator with XRE-family HTH domain